LPDLRYCPGFCLEGLRKLTEIFSSGSPASSGHLNPGFPELGKLTNHLTTKRAKSSRRKCRGKVKGKKKKCQVEIRKY
jgi:hypothetical protein